MYRAKIFLMLEDRTPTQMNGGVVELTIRLKPVELVFYEEPTTELVKDTLATFVIKGGEWRCLPNDVSLKFEAEECGE